MQKNTEGQELEQREPMPIDLRKVADVILPKTWLILLIAVLGERWRLHTHIL